MPFDLAISEKGDLVVAGNRDLQGTSGNPLVEQRIRLRLQIPRGSWLYDEDKTLGSLAHQIMKSRPDRAYDLPSIVQEALRPMEDITVHEVEIVDAEPSPDGIVRSGDSPGVRIYYTPSEGTVEEEDMQTFLLGIPLVTGVQ
jgi:hypothetical protein